MPPSADPFPTKRFSKDTVIFREGETADEAYIVRSGAVEITTEKNGRKVVLNRVTQHQLLGEMALIDDQPRSATATAIQDTEVLIMGRETLESKLMELDHFMRTWVRHLMARVRELSTRVDR